MPTVILTAASGNWRAPTYLRGGTVSVKCWGPGGGGAGGIGGGGGGGGGAFAFKSAVAVTAGNVYAYTVGQGGPGSEPDVDGGDGTSTTKFTGDAGAIVEAAFGLGGIEDGNPGAGGLSSDCTPNTDNPPDERCFSGGDGGSASGAEGGGGGGGAGDAGDGNIAVDATAGTGGSEGGGDGGNGSTGAAGVAGSIPGGGGGGGHGDNVGGDGARGQIEITYSLSLPILTEKQIGICPHLPPGFSYRNWQALIRAFRSINACLVQFNAGEGTVATFTVVTDVRYDGTSGCYQIKTREITTFSSAAESDWTEAGCP